MKVDQYVIQARLLPALLSLFPIFVTIAVWMPALYKLGTDLVGLAFACGITTAFAHFSRARGRTIQEELVREWGGLPTTIWLRQSDTHLEQQTKLRYYQFLENNVPEWTAPTRDEEEAHPDEADLKYGSAVRWLLELTRDTKKYPLLFAENISYGFRRNALALKPFAIIFAVIAAGFGPIQLHNTPPADLLGQYPFQIASLLVSLLLLSWWTLGVTRSWVRDAADAYARALLAVCDRS